MKKIAMVASLCVLFVAAGCRLASADITITLQNAFIQKYANRATINTDVRLDATAPRPHAASEDGDMHAAGVSSDIGLATVVEIMNAREPSEGKVETRRDEQDYWMPQRILLFASRVVEHSFDQHGNDVANGTLVFANAFAQLVLELKSPTLKRGFLTRMLFFTRTFSLDRDFTKWRF